VATFYAQFHLQPRGRYVIRVCRGTACHVRGSLKILEKVKEITGIGENETTEDLRFTIEPVACLGACGLAPVMVINDQTFGRLTPDKIQGILDQFE
jgi:NADH-quinone oxidoreductase subunit E